MSVYFSPLSPDPPTFTNHPANTISPALSDTMLSCSVTGFPIPRITWLKNGLEIGSLKEFIAESEVGSGVFSDAYVVTTSTDSSTQSILYLSDVDLNDTAAYTCRAENELASVEVTVSTPGRLEVQCKQ